MDRWLASDAGGFSRRETALGDPGALDLLFDCFVDRPVLVAHVEVAGLGLDRPGGDQHAFEKTVIEMGIETGDFIHFGL
jgi:hypothetical protein